MCGKPAKGENCAEARPEKTRRSQPAPRSHAPIRPRARARREELPQKHPDVVRRPVGGGALLALPARTGAKCKHDAANELRRRPVDWPLALSFDPSGPASDDAHSQREYSDAYMCAFVCELTRRPVSRWRLRAPLERKKNGEGTYGQGGLGTARSPKGRLPYICTAVPDQPPTPIPRRRHAPTARREGDPVRPRERQAPAHHPGRLKVVCGCHAAHRCPVKRARSRVPLQPWTAASSKQLRRCCVLASLTESAGKIGSPAVEKRRALLPKS